ncbi:MAG: hypothetical protein AUG74_00475 [Bacteroidetes bacterium 13_1_20CM_4_60_6]|nr:MAG: hypothetical protein AUG74_00475 [Bacteroidetes bacterium 13_1_20CM_4_60_6]
MEVQPTNQRKSKKRLWRYLRSVALIVLWLLLAAGVSWKIWSDIINRTSPEIEKLAQDAIRKTEELCGSLRLNARPIVEQRSKESSRLSRSKLQMKRDELA